MPYTTSPSSLRPFKCSDSISCSIRCRCDRGDGIIRKISAFVSPTGQFYVTTPSGVRIDCHNQQTARYYLHNGVSVSLAVEAHKLAQVADFASRPRVNA